MDELKQKLLQFEITRLQSIINQLKVEVEDVLKRMEQWVNE